jgi:hypothetical protein
MNYELFHAYCVIEIYDLRFTITRSATEILRMVIGRKIIKPLIFTILLVSVRNCCQFL